jgi:hypothetical protein
MGISNLYPIAAMILNKVTEVFLAVNQFLKWNIYINGKKSARKIKIVICKDHI